MIVTFPKIATGVEIKLGDGSTIKGFPNDAIFLDGKGPSASDWKGKLGFPWVVWDGLSVGQKITVGKEYEVYLELSGEIRREKLRILSLPEVVEGQCVYVDCCGPDHR